MNVALEDMLTAAGATEQNIESYLRTEAQSTPAELTARVDLLMQLTPEDRAATCAALLKRRDTRPLSPSEPPTNALLAALASATPANRRQRLLKIRQQRQPVPITAPPYSKATRDWASDNVVASLWHITKGGNQKTVRSYLFEVATNPYPPVVLEVSGMLLPSTSARFAYPLAQQCALRDAAERFMDLPVATYQEFIQELNHHSYTLAALERDNYRNKGVLSLPSSGSTIPKYWKIDASFITDDAVRLAVLLSVLGV